jgi:hypothetical protein
MVIHLLRESRLIKRAIVAVEAGPACAVAANGRRTHNTTPADTSIMTTSERGDGWTVEVDDSVMVWEFRPGMDLSAFREDAYRVFEELLETHDVRGMVTVVKLDDPFDQETFDIWERSADRAERGGVDRWAVVADGIKALSLRGTVDTGELETFTTEDRSEAVKWAR